jgi:hypothetical protein
MRTNDEFNNVMSKKSLEILLLEKNRTLQSEQTQIKVAQSDLESRLIAIIDANMNDNEFDLSNAIDMSDGLSNLVYLSRSY